MPYQSLRKCFYPGCNVLVKSGRCVAHARIRDRELHDSDIKKLYNSLQWKAMRAAQLAKSPWCEDCLRRDAHVLATEVDHIVPHHGKPQLFFDEHNLQSLCKPDHSSKTANEVLHPST